VRNNGDSTKTDNNLFLNINVPVVYMERDFITAYLRGRRGEGGAVRYEFITYRWGGGEWGER
jgi:hypothetical protein